MTVDYFAQRQRWRYNFQMAGTRYQGYCDHPKTQRPASNRTEAKQIEELIKAQMRLDLEAGQAQRTAFAAAAAGPSLAMILDEYLTQADETNRSAFNNEDYAAELLAYFGAGRLLADLGAAEIEAYRRWCAAQTVKIYIGGPRKGAGRPPAARFRDSGRLRSPGTVNKYLLALEAAWKAAYRRHHAKDPKFPPCPPIEPLKTPKHLPNPIAAEHVARLLAVAPPHLVVTMALATHTSMRLQEILGLEWSEVHLDLGIIRLKPERTKALDGRVVHLTATAAALLQLLAEKRPAAEERVVLYWPSGFGLGRPRPIGSIRTAWLNALRDAGLAGRYRFHDLRGVIGTYLAREGVAPLTLQKWLGHKDIKTTLRYVALAEAPQREASRLAGGYRATDGVLERLEAPAAKRSTRDEARRYVGVYPAGKTRYEAKLVVTLRENGRSTKTVIYLGCHDTAELAARAYDEAAKKYPGRRLNFDSIEAPSSAESLTQSRLQVRAANRRSG